jgi:hypothetical protein
MTTIAGHTMVDGPGGRACKFCGKTWLSILDQRDFWRPGEKGIAHIDPLNEAECQQLRAELDRIYAAALAA